MVPLKAIPVSGTCLSVFPCKQLCCWEVSISARENYKTLYSWRIILSMATSDSYFWNLSLSTCQVEICRTQRGRGKGCCFSQWPLCGPPIGMDHRVMASNGLTTEWDRRILFCNKLHNWLFLIGKGQRISLSLDFYAKDNFGQAEIHRASIDRLWRWTLSKAPHLEGTLIRCYDYIFP